MQKQSNPITVLVAPLNWGLGHATRCVPIINCLLSKNVNVLIASDGGALDLLKKEFPTLPAFSLPAYNIRYPFDSMIVNMLLQLPKIQSAIWQEHAAIRDLVEEHKVNAIISDNRFGCYSDATYNVFMTHQLNIMAPFSFAEKIMATWNNKTLNRFDLCWVPDFKEAPGLAGKLSHPSPVDSVQYIGPLSRMKAAEAQKKHDAIAVLSGPEPQRTKLEELLLLQMKELPLRFLLVRGKMTDKSPERKDGNVSIVGHLLGDDLEKAIAASTIVIARSGYTTIMDLVALEKPAILIPTPGQTEQVYLGELFKETGTFLVSEQSNLSLKRLLKNTENHFSSFNFQKDTLLEKHVNKLLEDLKSVQ